MFKKTQNLFFDLLRLIPVPVTRDPNNSHILGVSPPRHQQPMDDTIVNASVFFT